MSYTKKPITIKKPVSKSASPAITVIKKDRAPISTKKLSQPIYDSTKKNVGTQELKPVIWNAPLNKHLISRMVMVEQAGNRQGTSKVKTRGEVSGGGKKPWRQKGTGRARVGSSRNPVWTGGGVAFGPTGNQNYKKKANKKEFAAALRSALASRQGEDKILFLKEFKMEKPSTKQWIQLVNTLIDFPAKSKSKMKKIVFVIPAEIAHENLFYSAQNLQHQIIVAPEALSLSQLLWSDYLIIFPTALAALEQRLGAE